MTEDDTFRKLKQLPWYEVRDKLDEAWYDFVFNRKGMQSADRKTVYIQILRECGWTQEEWKQAHDRR